MPRSPVPHSQRYCSPPRRRAGSRETLALLALFNTAGATFNEIDTVPTGLGRGFNMNSCAACHGFPAAGGNCPQINPQIAVANLAGAANTIPSFINTNGPVRKRRRRRA